MRRFGIHQGFKIAPFLLKVFFKTFCFKLVLVIFECHARLHSTLPTIRKRHSKMLDFAEFCMALAQRQYVQQRQSTLLSQSAPKAFNTECLSQKMAEKFPVKLVL